MTYRHSWPRRISLLLIALPCLALSYLCLSNLQHSDLASAVIFAGLAIPGLVVAGYLLMQFSETWIIDDRGMSVTRFGRRRHLPWHDIQSIQSKIISSRGHYVTRWCIYTVSSPTATVGYFPEEIPQGQELKQAMISRAGLVLKYGGEGLQTEIYERPSP